LGIKNKQVDYESALKNERALKVQNESGIEKWGEGRRHALKRISK
jgi:hypothetical protein